MLVDVEVLDVSEEEARKLFLTIAPSPPWPRPRNKSTSASSTSPPPPPPLRAFWGRAAQTVFEPEPPGPNKELKEQFLILLTCRDEKEQVELLGRFAVEGLE